MLCERHSEMAEQIDDLDERVKYLELSDTETRTELKNLIKQVEKLVETLEKLMSNAWKILLGTSGAGMGFIFWYIQTQ